MKGLNSLLRSLLGLCHQWERVQSAPVPGSNECSSGGYSLAPAPIGSGGNMTPRPWIPIPWTTSMFRTLTSLIKQTRTSFSWRQVWKGHWSILVVTACRTGLIYTWHSVVSCDQITGGQFLTQVWIQRWFVPHLTTFSGMYLSVPWVKLKDSPLKWSTY